MMQQTINPWEVMLDGYKAPIVRKIAGDIKEKINIEVGTSGRYTKNKGSGSYIHKCHDEAEPKSEPKHYVKKSKYWTDKKIGSKHQLIVDLFKSGLSIEQVSIYVDVDKRYAREVIVSSGLVAKLPKNNRKAVVAHRVTGEFVGEYESIKAAANANMISMAEVHRCCSQMKKNSKGFVFRYKDVVTA